MKWFKRILILIVVLALILIGGGLILVATVNPNDYKEQIISLVKKQTGRDLTLAGNIDLSIFPWLGLQMGQTQLSNAEGFGDKPFASMELVNVRVALLPLIKGTVKADTIELKDLQLNLHRKKDGSTNWDDLVKSTDTAEPELEKTPSGGPPIALAIGGINIENAGVSWQDDTSNTSIIISPVNLRTGGLAIGEPFNLAADVQLENTEPAIIAKVQLNAQVTADPETQRYELHDTKLTLTANGESIPGGTFNADLETDITANLEAGTVKVMPLKLDASGLSLMGVLQATDINTTPKLSGDLKSNEFSPRALMRSMGQDVPQTTDNGVLKTVRLAMAFTGGTDNINVSDLNIRLDDTTITGYASVATFYKPKVRFMFSLDEIDVDRYLPPASKESDKTDTVEKPAEASPSDDKIELPVETLRSLDLEGSVKAGKVRISGLTLNNIQATVTGKNGLIKLSPLTTSLYEGTYKGGVSVDVRGNTPLFSANSDLSGVEFGKLSNDLLGKENAYLRGTTMLRFDLNTQGDRISTIKKQLAGSLNLEAKNGALQDAELAAKVEKVVAFLKGREPQPAGNELVFDSLTGSANIKNGVANNKDLSLITPIILARGEGDIDIGNDSVDYQLGLGLAGGGDPNAERTYIPLTVKGPFEDPKYGVDLKAALSGQALEKIEEKKQQLEEKKDALIEENKDKLKEKLQDKLKLKGKLF